VVHFATHGLVTGEIKHLAEPALVLSPPETPTEEDDGLLTASEVAGLKLDTDWVILSACNTAAGDQGNAQALSGLARAFFYAGARALLVSHWPVNSGAAVMLTTSAFEEMRRSQAAGTPIGRAEALRRAMLALIDHGSAREAHPANWAPFVVVGEGGREK
jgi:CHAT domain-containing protein